MRENECANLYLCKVTGAGNFNLTKNHFWLAFTGEKKSGLYLQIRRNSFGTEKHMQGLILKQSMKTLFKERGLGDHNIKTTFKYCSHMYYLAFKRC